MPISDKKVALLATDGSEPVELAQPRDALEEAGVTTSSVATDLKNAGVEWVDEEVMTDGNLITSQNSDDLPDFVQAIGGGLC